MDLYLDANIEGIEEDFTNFLINITRRNPLDIESYIRILNVVARSNNRAICRIQYVIRNWIIRRRQEKQKHYVCTKIQVVFRRWLAMHKIQKKGHSNCQNNAATKIQCLFRRTTVSRNITLRCLANFFGGGDPLFEQKTNFCSNDYSQNSVVEKAVIDSIWKSAKVDFKLFCKDEDEAQSRGYFWENQPLVLIKPVIDTVLSLIAHPSFDNGTKAVCFLLLYVTFWNIVESQHRTPDYEKYISKSQINQVVELCISNLASQDFGLFRGSVKVLCEIGHLSSDLLCIPSDGLKHLQTQLEKIYYRPANITLRDSFSIQLPGKDFVLNMSSAVPSDIVRLLHSSTRGTTSSWNELLFQNGYMRTLIGLTFHTMLNPETQIWIAVQNVWDEMPGGDIRFQSQLRSAARAIMKGNSAYESFDIIHLFYFIIRALKLEAYGSKKRFYHYFPSDSEQTLSCTCLIKLLIEFICELHSKKTYFDGVLLQIKEDFSMECFESTYSTQKGKEARGIFVDHPSLKTVLDPSFLKLSLSKESPAVNQLVGLYVARGMSYAALNEHITMENYISALKRHPNVLKETWFYRSKPTERIMEAEFAHCAASCKLTECFDLYAGNLLSLVNELGNTVLHTAAKDGSTDTIVYLLKRGYATGILITNNKGQNPIILAKQNKQHNCASLLEEAIQDRQDIDGLVALIENSTASTNQELDKKKKCKKKRSRNRCERKAKKSTTKFVCENDSFDLSLVPEESTCCNNANAVIKKDDKVSNSPIHPKSLKFRLKREISKKIFSIHKEIAKCKNVIEILDYEEDGTFSILKIENVDGTLEGLLSLSIDELSISARLDICHQILNGLNILCGKDIVHGSISPNNIFVVRSGKGPCDLTAKIGLVCQNEYSTRNQTPKGLFDPLSELEIKGPDRDIFAAGCTFSLLLCGNHILGIDYSDQLLNAKNHCLKDTDWLKKCAGVEACDLIVTMVRDKEKITECLSHPVFWKPSKRFLFISEIVRQKRKLPIGESLRLGRDWRTKILPSGILSLYVNRHKNHYGRGSYDLLRMLRNFYQRPPDEPECKDCFLIALDELRVFPFLFLDLRLIFGSFDDVVIE